MFHISLRNINSMAYGLLAVTRPSATNADRWYYTKLSTAKTTTTISSEKLYHTKKYSVSECSLHTNEFFILFGCATLPKQYICHECVVVVRCISRLTTFFWFIRCVCLACCSSMWLCKYNKVGTLVTHTLYFVVVVIIVVVVVVVVAQFFFIQLIFFIQNIKYKILFLFVLWIRTIATAKLTNTDLWCVAVILFSA